MDTEYTMTEFRTKNAIVRMYRPILTEEERARRMKAIEKAAVNLVLANRRLEEQRQRELSEAKASIFQTFGREKGANHGTEGVQPGTAAAPDEV